MALFDHKRKSKKPNPLERVANPRRDQSEAQEGAIADRFGGRVRKASGATPTQKGDVITRDLLIEAKTVIKEGARSIRVEADWLEKITREARDAGRAPALEIKIPSIRMGTEDTWIMVPSSYMARLLE